MKRITLPIIAAAIAAAAVLTACGGGSPCETTTFGEDVWTPTLDSPLHPVLTAPFVNRTGSTVAVTVRVQAQHELTGPGSTQIAMYGTASRNGAPFARTTDIRVSQWSPASFASVFEWTEDVPAGQTLRVSLVAAVVGQPQASTRLVTHGGSGTICPR